MNRFYASRSCIYVLGVLVLAILSSDHRTTIASPSIRVTHQQTCPPTDCAQDRVYGYQPSRYTTLRPVFYVAASNNLGDSGPVYKLINRGLPPSTFQETVSSLRPIPHTLLRSIAWQESHWLQFANTVQDTDNQYACTLLSGDCGYGLMQVTSCMDNGCGWFTPALVSSVYTYNLGVGTNILIEKWNTMPFAGANDHTMNEEWYYATTAYNGWSQCNDPNRDFYMASCPPDKRDAFNPLRPPYGEGLYTQYTYPYQEVIWGLMAHPELITVSTHRLWRPTRVANIPRGIFGLRGSGDWRPPSQAPLSVIHILPDLYVSNGVGASIHLRNPTTATLAAEVLLYNADHTFNRRWIVQIPNPPPFRLAPGSSHLLFLSDVFTVTENFSGYARVNASDGIEVTALSPQFYHKLYLPMVTNNHGGTCYERMSDGSFEYVQNGRPLFWSVSSYDKYSLADSTWFRDGHRGAYLGGYDYADDSLKSMLNIPTNARSAHLTYSWYIQSNELVSSEYDHLYVRLIELLNDDLIATLDEINNQDIRGEWQTETIDLLPYRGRDMRLAFEAENDFSNPTSFFVDVVSVQVCVP